MDVFFGGHLLSYSYLRDDSSSQPKSNLKDALTNLSNSFCVSECVFVCVSVVSGGGV